MDDRIEKLQQWVKEGKGCRHAKIEIGELGDSNLFSIWVYDYRLSTGQSIKNVDEINLENKAEDEERKQYEKLKAKFELEEVRAE